MRLRSSQQRSPTTPTSPLPVIMEPISTTEEEEGGMDEYAQVDLSKVGLGLGLEIGDRARGRARDRARARVG